MTFEDNLERVKSIPQFFLGQQVTTKEGRGIIVKLMDYIYNPKEHS